MGSKPTIKGETVLRYLKENPSLTTTELSVLIHEEIKGLFKDRETTRSCIRYYRGKCGNFNRKQTSNKSNFSHNKLAEMSHVSAKIGRAHV